MVYITTSDVKTYLGISGSTDDTFIDSLVTQATAIINRATRRNFEAATGTRLFHATDDVDGGILFLDDDLATASGLVVTNGDGVTVSATERKLLPANKAPYYAIKILASVNKSWTFGDDPDEAISVAGKWGWSTSAPNDVVHATRRLVAYLYRQKGINADADRPIIAPDGSVIMPHKLPADVAALLKPYMRGPG